MGTAELQQNTYTKSKSLREKVNDILRELKMNKAELALKIQYSRSAVSQYLNGKYQSDPTEIEAKLMEFVRRVDPKAFVTVYSVGEIRYQPKIKP